MPDKAKSPIIIMALLILISLSLAGSGYYLLQKEKTKNLMLQDQLESLKIKEEAAEAKLIEYKKMISQLETKLKDAESDIYTLTGNLEEQTKEKEVAVGQVQQLRQDLQQQKGMRAVLETQLLHAQKGAEKTTVQLKEMASMKKELEEKIKALETQAQQMQARQEAQAQGVELGTIVVAPEDTGATAKTKRGSSVSKKQPKEQAAKQPKEQAAKQPKEQAVISYLDGKVLVVNKEYNFIVINLGSKDGVKPGDVFALYHNNRYLGDIKVAKTHDSMSAADFLTASIKDTVSEGDMVVHKAK